MPATIQKRQPCTILLPLFNGSAFLVRSITNLCGIAGPQDEILIIDDGSVDISNEQIKQLCDMDSRIVLHKCEHRGLVEALNYGIRVASHELIARADVDDIYEMNRIQLQVEYLENNPQISAVFSDYVMVSHSGAQLGIFPSAVSPELTSFSLFSSQRTPHPSVMYRKSMVLSVGGYRLEDFPAEDLALWIRLVKVSKIGSIPQSLLKYTIHSSSITSTNQQLMKKKSLALRKQYGSSGDFTKILNSAAKLLVEYRGSAYRNLRILFFLEDLVNFNHLTNGVHRRKMLIIITNQIFRRNVFLIVPVIYVFRMKLKRMKLMSK